MTDTHEPIAANRLKALRKESKLTLEKISSRLGMEISTYRHYEERFKGRYLPQDLILSLLDAFEGTGIDRARIRALGTDLETEQGFADTSDVYGGSARGKRLLHALDPVTPAEHSKVEQALKIGTDGHFLSVVATVDRAGVDKLIKRLEIMREMLD